MQQQIGGVWRIRCTNAASSLSANGQLRNISHRTLMKEARPRENKEVERRKKHSKPAAGNHLQKILNDIKTSARPRDVMTQNPQLVALRLEKEELKARKEKLMQLLVPKSMEETSGKNNVSKPKDEVSGRKIDGQIRMERQWKHYDKKRDAPFSKSGAKTASLQSFKISGKKSVTPSLDPFGNIRVEVKEHEQPDITVVDQGEKVAKYVYQRPLSENLRLSVPPSGTIYIDDDLTVDFETEVPVLQSNIFQLQERLRSAYPRIDTLPYEVWSSNNRNTLRTWLKILITRWQTRFDEVKNDGRDIDQGVKQVLDLMVRNHDLSNEAAERMAMRWHDVFDRRHASLKDEESIDWDEYEAGGMSFLMDEDAAGGNQEKLDKKEAAWNSSRFAVQDTHATPSHLNTTRRLYSTSTRPPANSEPTTNPERTPEPTLPHLTPTGSAHMVSVSSKAHTTRTAIAVGTVYFSNPTPLSLIRSNSLKKGDVLSVSRIAGIMAAKKCPDLIPLCHPIALSHVGVELRVFGSEKKKGNDMGCGGVQIEAKVQCTGPTGVEMEALTSVMGTALSVVDMCKAVDKFQRVQDVRVVLKEGGKSGVWREEGWRSWQE